MLLESLGVPEVVHGGTQARRGGANPMINSIETTLRHDLLYLRCIITHAINHHRAQTPSDCLTQATLQDYLTLLTTDALQDEKLAQRLAPTLARLQEELHKETETLRIQNKDPTPQAYYQGYLHSLENTLNHKHNTDLLLHEQIIRRQFHQTWEQTRKKLGL